MTTRTWLRPFTLLALLALLLALTLPATSAPIRPPDAPLRPAVVVEMGTLPVTSGPDIKDTQLRQMLDAFIPTTNAHSTLLVFTQCFAGNMADDFAGRAGTAVLSATAPGERAQYGGYHDDAAAALYPGVGRTSDDVHAAGVAGKSGIEHPFSNGAPVSLEPTSDTGEIRSRHVLIYAGQPNAADEADCRRIENNFENKLNTTVTTIGCKGNSPTISHPATMQELSKTLEFIGSQMGPNEQFILFVTDHGNADEVDVAPACEGQSCTSAPLTFSDGVEEAMGDDPDNHPAVTLLSPDEVTAPITVTLSSGAVFTNVLFHQPVDLDGDGSVTGPGEGWMAIQPVEEAQLDPNGTTIIATHPSAPLVLTWIALESGNIARRTPFQLYLPLVLRGN